MMMEKRIEAYLDLLVERYPALECVKTEIATAYSIIADCYRNGGKLLMQVTAVLPQMQNTLLANL